MSTDHMLLLSLSQAERLASSCATYRAYAWQKLAPCPERNQTMRAAQAVQGRLTELRTGEREQLSLALTEEERQALRMVMSTLIQVCGADPPSAERNQLLENLYMLRVLIERMGRQTMTR